MTAVNQDFELRKGDTKTLTCTVTDSDGAVVDITAATVKWEAALSVNSTTKSIAKSTGGSGIVLTTPASGIFTVTIDPADTSSLATGRYFHEAEVTDASSRVSTVLTGTMTLKEDLV